MVQKQWQLQAPSVRTINDPLYGTVSNQKTDNYTLMMSSDAVIWFYGSDLTVEITISSAEGTQTITPYLRYMPTNVDNMEYINKGNYTITISPSLTSQADYYLSIHYAPPDSLESTDNSKTNPVPLTEFNVVSGYNLNVPTGVDWFSISIAGTGQVHLAVTGNIIITVFNGTQIFTFPSSSGDDYFQTNAENYVLKVYSNDIAVLSYSIFWEFTPLISTAHHVGTSGPPGSSTTKLKIGYPFMQTMILIMIPMLMMINLRKHQKLSIKLLRDKTSKH